MRIDQLLPSVVEGDAISADAAEIQRRLRDLGYQSEIYVKETGGKPRDDVTVLSAEQLRGGADALMYHLSVGSDLTDRFLAHPGVKVAVYHNITPPYFFEGWDPPMVDVMNAGRRELRRAAALSDFGIGVSEFNRRELEAAGFERTAVLPILLNPGDFDTEPDEDALNQLRSLKENGPLWLYVGRFVPNKCQADVVRAFCAYKRAAQPGATLVLVGSSFTASYREATLQLAEDLGIADSVLVRGQVSPAELSACYQMADVFVCLSEHEGFCVPLIEAMHHQLPIVAYRAGAIPETVAGAAALLDDKDPVLVAATVDQILTDRAVRESLRRRASARLADLSPERSAQALHNIVKEILA